jgi:hypothetical protein
MENSENKEKIILNEVIEQLRRIVDEKQKEGEKIDFAKRVKEIINYIEKRT